MSEYSHYKQKINFKEKNKRKTKHTSAIMNYVNEKLKSKNIIITYSNNYITNPINTLNAVPLKNKFKKIKHRNHIIKQENKTMNPQNEKFSKLEKNPSQRHSKKNSNITDNNSCSKKPLHRKNKLSNGNISSIIEKAYNQKEIYMKKTINKINKKQNHPSINNIQLCNKCQYQCHCQCQTFNKSIDNLNKVPSKNNFINNQNDTSNIYKAIKNLEKYRLDNGGNSITMTKSCSFFNDRENENILLKIYKKPRYRLNKSVAGNSSGNSGNNTGRPSGYIPLTPQPKGSTNNLKIFNYLFKDIRKNKIDKNWFIGLNLDLLKNDKYNKTSSQTKIKTHIKNNSSSVINIGRNGVKIVKVKYFSKPKDFFIYQNQIK